MILIEEALGRLRDCHDKRRWCSDNSRALPLVVCLHSNGGGSGGDVGVGVGVAVVKLDVLLIARETRRAELRQR
jgi:hypothetical protein